MVTRALTGPIGSWETTRLPDPIQAKRPPLPPWARTRPADIARLERHREAATATADQS